VVHPTTANLWAVAGTEAFRVESVRDERHAVIIVTGDLDAATAPRLRQALLDLETDGVDRVVLDLRRLSFVDSFGLGVIISTKSRLSQEGNALCLVAGEGQRTLRRLLEIAGVDRLLPVHATVEDAVDACLRDSAA
jgi:anti-sigma B factor antagonist